jgi:hypothetical protein
MSKSKDVQLLKCLASFALPLFYMIGINHLSKAEREVKHFLGHSLGQTRELYLNRGSDLLDGSEWLQTIVKVLPRVIERVQFYKFSFSKEQVESIVDSSLHLEELLIVNCKLRKWCCLAE